MREAATTVAIIGSTAVASAAITHHMIKDKPTAEQDIYWRNFGDPQRCRIDLERHRRNRGP